MSEEGDKTCPLCAEEMDTTDQQLKPCKCGYEICVWCWHQIMDMAEKDGTEGRCPACRTPYDKEKIVGTAPSSGRLALENNVGKKKSHKGKKTSEGRKQLASVRVIQRNLVYVVGLPLCFADEDLLQRKEYFGRYGKVLKVSISRTATGAIQHFPNSTCSVYITYSKEEEAIRCIQSVHGFVLDGRSLRACFGTTKYCHAWLRNMPCSNPDCLYLHEVGSQEDSFTKDEIISAYTRVQQITGPSNSTQRRSGNVLPPPADEYSGNIAPPGKPVTKSSVNTNNSAINVRVSPPNSSSGRSSALPAGASWGTRGSSNQPVLGSTQCSNEPDKQKLDASNGGTGQISLLRYETGKKLVHNEERMVSQDKSKTETLEPCTGKKLVHNEECMVSQDKSKTETLEPYDNESDEDRRHKVSKSSLDSAHSATLPVNRQVRCQHSTELPPNSVNIVDSSIRSNGLVTCSTTAIGPSQFSSLRNDTGKVLVLDEECTVSQDKRKIETLEPWDKESDVEGGNNISESSLESAHSVAFPLNRQALGQPTVELPPTSTNTVDTSFTPDGMALVKESVAASDGNVEDICSDILSMGINKNSILENGGCDLRPRETMTSQLSGTTESTSAEVGLNDALPNFSLKIPSQLTQVDFPEMEDDLFSFEKQRIKDPEYAVIRKPEFSHVSQNNSSFCFPQFNNAESCVEFGTQDVDRIGKLVNITSNSSIGFPQTIHRIPEVDNVEYSNLTLGKGKRLLPGRYAGEVTSGAIDTGESGIISNISSMDFDSSDEPLTYPQNLAKLLGETDRRQAPLGVSGSLKIHNSNQSRFSFAREEDLMSQGSNHVNSVGYLEQGLKQHPSGHDFSNRNAFQVEKLVGYNSFPVINGIESETFTGNHSHHLSSRPSGSRSHVSAPPGFSVPSKAPPPGFASHETRQQSFDTVSGSHMLDAFLRNQYQAPSGGNNTANNGDIELIDPAILAVGKGVVPSGFGSPGVDFRSNYSSQLSAYEEARFPSFLQGSLPQHLNQRFTDHGDGYSSLGDPYRIPSRVMEQTLTNSFSPFSQFTQPQSRSGITSNGSWDGWNDIRSGNNFSMAELIRSEKLGFNNKFYGGYEDSKFRMPSSGNLYDGTYGI